MLQSQHVMSSHCGQVAAARRKPQAGGGGEAGFDTGASCVREEPSLPKLVAMWWLGSDWRLGSQGPHSFHSFPQSHTPGEGRVRVEVGNSHHPLQGVCRS